MGIFIWAYIVGFVLVVNFQNNVICFLLYIYFLYCELLLCISYSVFRPTVHFYMYICGILPIQLLGCHSEINACLVMFIHSAFKATQIRR